MFSKKVLIPAYISIVSICAMFILTHKSWLVVGDTIKAPQTHTVMDSINAICFPSVSHMKKTIIYYFDPECDFCSATLKKNNQRIVSCQKYNFIYISFRDSIASVKELKKYLNQDSFNYLIDRSKSVSNYLNIHSYPTIVEYLPGSKQYTIYQGSDKIDLLLNSIN